jgi:type III secretion protein L
MGLAFLITTDNLQLLGERKVLKESEYAALLDATAVLDIARKEGRRLVEQAISQAQVKRREAYEEGLARAKAEYAEKLVALAADSQAQLQGLREVMAQLVVKAVGQFIAEADMNNLFEAALLRVDKLIRSEPYLSVRVSPKQEAKLRIVLAKLQGDANWTMNVSVQPDATLPDGDCVLKTASGTIEIGVNAQLEAFQRALRHGVFNGDGQAVQR